MLAKIKRVPFLLQATVGVPNTDVPVSEGGVCTDQCVESALPRPKPLSGLICLDKQLWRRESPRLDLRFNLGARFNWGVIGGN